MTSKKALKFLTLGLLAIWTVVTFAALGGMYKLWWDRERVQYLGKSLVDQRTAVWSTSGLPRHLLVLWDTLENTWPENVSYSAIGDHNQLSYLKYLLIPRSPSGSSLYTVNAGGGSTPAGLPLKQRTEGNKPFPAASLLLSLLTVLGISLVLRAACSRIKFSLPEMCGCVCLLLMGCVVVSRALFATAVPAFYFLAISGIVSWIVLLLQNRTEWRYLKVRYQFGWRRTLFHNGLLSHPWHLLFIVIIALNLLWVMLMSVIVVPDDWDAWAIWAAKAKVLALGNGPLFDVSYFGHADYPLLWPSVWAYSGWLGGGWEEMWSRGWGAVFLLLCLWEIYIVIERNTGRSDLGLLGAALFASMPMTPLIASWSYAEAPFWFLTTSSFGCILLWKASRMHICILIAAVLAAGAAYTKNEGVLFSVLAFIWLLFLPGKRRLLGPVSFAGVFLLLYIPWLVWIKIICGLGSHATVGLHLDYENILRVSNRIPKAFVSIFDMWTDIKRWNVVLWGTCLVTLFCAVINRIRNDLIVPVGMLLGYFVVVLFHTDDIYWQIGTSWDRLTVQTMPLLLIILISGVWGMTTAAQRRV